MTARTTKPVNVADAIRAHLMVTQSFYKEGCIGWNEQQALRAALPRAEALEALVEAADAASLYLRRHGRSTESQAAALAISNAVRRVREAK